MDELMKLGDLRVNTLQQMLEQKDEELGQIKQELNVAMDQNRQLKYHLDKNIA